MRVLRGMQALLSVDHPTPIVQRDSPEVEDHLMTLGYASRRFGSSANRV